MPTYPDYFVSGLFLALPLLGAFLGSLFFGLDFVIDFLLVLVLRVIYPHAHQLMLDGHDRMAQEHAPLGGTHDFHEVPGLLCAETGTITAVADRFRDAVRAAVHFCHDSGQQCRTLGAEFVS